MGVAYLRGPVLKRLRILENKGASYADIKLALAAILADVGDFDEAVLVEYWTVEDLLEEITHYAR